MGNVIPLCRRKDQVTIKQPVEVEKDRAEYKSDPAYNIGVEDGEDIVLKHEQAASSVQEAAENTKDHHLLIFQQVDRVKRWQKLFKQRSKNSTVGSVAKGLYTFPFPRAAYCNEKNTVVYQNVRDSSTVLVELGATDVAPTQKLEDIPACKEITVIATPEGHAQEEVKSTYGTASLAVFVDVDDFEWWYEGFQNHGHSTKGTWGFEVTMPRSDFCHEHRTLVFRGVDDPNKVAVLLYGVDLETFQSLQKDATFLRLQGELGEKGPRRVKAMSDENKLHPVDVDCTKFLLCLQPTT